MSGEEYETEPFPVESWCPDCPPREIKGAWETQYCRLHNKFDHGDLDIVAMKKVGSDYLTATEAGGATNRAVCETVHKGEDSCLSAHSIS